jgi:hypothetical protein
MASGSAIHVLIIDLPERSGAGPAAFAFSREDQLDWLKGAAERGASLVALLTDDGIELYSTERNRRLAFRAVLTSLESRVKELPVLAKARTIAKSGADAARHLLGRASGRSANLEGDLRFTTQLHTATALSAYSAALGPELGSLFRAAVTVSRRVRKETSLGDPSATGALRELERMSAERIVEEELAAWQAQEAELSRLVEQVEFNEPPTRVEAPLSARVSSMTGLKSLLVGFLDEPGSAVRAKIDTALASSDG